MDQLTAAEHLHAASEHALDGADQAAPADDRDRSAVLALAHGLVGLALLMDTRTDRLLADIKTSPEKEGQP